MEMFCACASALKAKSASARMMNRILSSSGILLMAADSNAKLAQGFVASRARGLVDLRVEAAALAVHGHDQRAEAAHAELPQRLGIEVVHVEVFDCLNPRRVRGRRGNAKPK